MPLLYQTETLTVQIALPWPPDRFCDKLSQSGWTDLIPGHASLQSVSDNLFRISCTKHFVST